MFFSPFLFFFLFFPFPRQTAARGGGGGKWWRLINLDKVAREETKMKARAMQKRQGLCIFFFAAWTLALSFLSIFYPYHTIFFSLFFSHFPIHSCVCFSPLLTSCSILFASGSFDNHIPAFNFCPNPPSPLSLSFSSIFSFVFSKFMSLSLLFHSPHLTLTLLWQSHTPPRKIPPCPGKKVAFRMNPLF